MHSNYVLVLFAPLHPLAYVYWQTNQFFMRYLCKIVIKYYVIVYRDLFNVSYLNIVGSVSALSELIR